MANPLTAERLREVLHYDPDTNVFTWRARTSNRIRVGDVAGSFSLGYRIIMIDRRPYKASRLAWLWMTRKWPEGDLDHANLDRADDHWNNLREATHSQNLGNQRAHKDNKSGLKGVYWSPRGRKWRANCRLLHLGYFTRPEAAHAAYCAAAQKYFGEFARFA